MMPCRSDPRVGESTGHHASTLVERSAGLYPHATPHSPAVPRAWKGRWSWRAPTRGRPDARARPQCTRPAAGAVLHRDRRSADRGDAVQRSVGRLRRRLGRSERLHHRDDRLHRLLGRLHRHGPARHRCRRLLQLRLARLRTDDRDGRGTAHRGLLSHLRGRRHGRHGLLRQQRRSTTGSASTSRSGCSSSARSRR